MTKTVSARISNKHHAEIQERCNKIGCTINEWLNAGIDYILNNYSDFDFGEEDDEVTAKQNEKPIPTAKVKPTKIIPTEKQAQVIITAVDGKPVKLNSEGKYEFV